MRPELPILKKQTNWQNLYFYQKAVVLYQMTVVFCRRFLPKFGDRTVDQMVQAARSGKQNIVEGFADGVTSTEMELKLLNVARASIKELKEDYLDYLRAHQRALWRPKLHPRYDGMLKFCRSHNALEDYEPYFAKWNDEEFANCANTLCHMVDKMMSTHMAKMAADFKEKRRHPRTHDRRAAGSPPDPERGNRRAQGGSLRSSGGDCPIEGEWLERIERLEVLERLEFLAPPSSMGWSDGAFFVILLA